MKQPKNATDVHDGDVQAKTAPIPTGQVHTWMLPVTVVAPTGTEAQQARLSDEVQEEIGELINSELRRLGLATAKAFVGDRLHDLSEVEADMATSELPTLWPVCG
jgi:hypothetical protein